MLTLGSRVRYGDHDCIVVGRTIETNARYDLLFPASRRIEPNVPGKDLELLAIGHPLQAASEPGSGDDLARRC